MFRIHIVQQLVGVAVTVVWWQRWTRKRRFVVALCAIAEANLQSGIPLESRSAARCAIREERHLLDPSVHNFYKYRIGGSAWVGAGTERCWRGCRRCGARLAELAGRPRSYWRHQKNFRPNPLRALRGAVAQHKDTLYENDGTSVDRPLMMSVCSPAASEKPQTARIMRSSATFGEG